ncbi:hypothetical protein Catovirus_1_131 [Catovirus CTV1]|uniref:Uncharacterized protein n=1 Tax=Catovirus CTV1 TaxID=1977631 RepID=A0A1V0S8Q3_9VIRU|nr:hypothetical protein Catovirus_1_131 [Catovirus CTV1]
MQLNEDIIEIVSQYMNNFDVKNMVNLNMRTREFISDESYLYSKYMPSLLEHKFYNKPIQTDDTDRIIYYNENHSEYDNVCCETTKYIIEITGNNCNVYFLLTYFDGYNSSIAVKLIAKHANPYVCNNKTYIYTSEAMGSFDALSKTGHMSNDIRCGYIIRSTCTSVADCANSVVYERYECSINKLYIDTSMSNEA